MRKQLFIQLPVLHGPERQEPEGNADAAAATMPASWVLRDVDRPAGTLFHGNLNEAAAQAVGARVSVLAPGEDVLLAQVELPMMKQQRLARAVPFALEEQLAEDVEDLHVAVGRRDARGRVANAVVARSTLDAWLTQLKAAGLQPDVVSPEIFGVPWDETTETDSWSMMINGARALLRTGAQTGMAFDIVNLAPVVRACLDAIDQTPPARLNVAACGDSVFADTEAHRELAALCKERAVDLSLRQQDEACSVVLAQGFNEQNAINLLQGDYSRKEQLEKLLRPWRPALILAGAWLLLQVGMLTVEYNHLSALSADQKTQIESVYREAFPQARNIVNPRVQMERGLEKLRGGGANEGFLALLAQSGAILKDIKGAQLRTLRFKGDKLDLDIDMPDLQTLDKLKQRLIDEAKLKVEIVSASSREGKVESRLSLQSALKGSGQ